MQTRARSQRPRRGERARKGPQTQTHRHMRRQRPAPELQRERRILERELLDELAALRSQLLAESKRFQRGTRWRAKFAHRCCQRPRNQMRISPLEARAIEIAFHTDAQLRPHLPDVLARLETELPRLHDSEERQSFDCPLLDGKQCLVHARAKPIGCLAWHDGRDYTKLGWEAFARRDELNDRLHGRSWRLRVIPLWLKRVFRGRRRSSAPRRETPPKSDDRGRAAAATRRPSRRRRPDQTSGTSARTRRSSRG